MCDACLLLEHITVIIIVKCMYVFFFFLTEIKINKKNVLYNILTEVVCNLYLYLLKTKTNNYMQINFMPIELLCKSIIIIMESSEFTCLMTSYKQGSVFKVLNFQFLIYFFILFNYSGIISYKFISY